MMDADDARALANGFFLGQDKVNGPPPQELCAPTYRAEIAGFPPMDAAAHGEFARAFYAAFRDLYHTIDETHPTDTGAAVRFTLRGTHRGPFMGIPASDRAIEVGAIVLLTVEGGKVTHLRGIFDQMGLMKQLGMMPV